MDSWPWGEVSKLSGSSRNRLNLRSLFIGASYLYLVWSRWDPFEIGIVTGDASRRAGITLVFELGWEIGQVYP